MTPKKVKRQRALEKRRIFLEDAKQAGLTALRHERDRRKAEEEAEEHKLDTLLAEVKERRYLVEQTKYSSKEEKQPFARELAKFEASVAQEMGRRGFDNEYIAKKLKRTTRTIELYLTRGH